MQFHIKMSTSFRSNSNSKICVQRDSVGKKLFTVSMNMESGNIMTKIGDKNFFISHGKPFIINEHGALTNVTSENISSLMSLPQKEMLVKVLKESQKCSYSEIPRSWIKSELSSLTSQTNVESMEPIAGMSETLVTIGGETKTMLQHVMNVYQEGGLKLPFSATKVFIKSGGEIKYICSLDKGVPDKYRDVFIEVILGISDKGYVYCPQMSPAPVKTHFGDYRVVPAIILKSQDTRDCTSPVLNLFFMRELNKKF